MKIDCWQNVFVFLRQHQNEIERVLCIQLNRIDFILFHILHINYFVVYFVFYIELFGNYSRKPAAVNEIIEIDNDSMARFL